MDYEEICYEVADGRARITLARPDKHNAMTPRLLEELEHAVWDADDDRSVPCMGLLASIRPGSTECCLSDPIEEMQPESPATTSVDASNR